ncbi:Mitochondrial uncoupling protein 3 [Tetrabaena socialis]|uniref:Mitochondrial uncoupling protein 3 n=1 Tax=Tetrabaena socialis TaxID=47790 RepID=A0A2J8A1U8_9CHLO|nr:Mitochondrial uncoupling protein 3 [Tetrabaena socialis]|eukprot:PNH06480.1 Mitochondrial uncoupling protein 3 [Tetrabaena socialis]
MTASPNPKPAMGASSPPKAPSSLSYLRVQGGGGGAACSLQPRPKPSKHHARVLGLRPPHTTDTVTLLELLEPTELTYGHQSSGGMRLGLYGPCREAVSALASPGGKRGDAGGMGVKIGAGIISGALAAAVTNPTELIKTRLQAKDNQARSTLDAVRQVLRQDGTVATYDSCKREVMGATGWGGDSLATQFAASSGAGLVTTTMTNPADVIKTRMFVAGGALKRTIPETIIEVYRADGLAGYFKGWTANYARLGPQTVITFMASEALRTALGLQGL